MYTKTKNTNNVFTSAIIEKITSNQDKLKKESLSISYGKSILPVFCLDSFRLIYEFNPANEEERIFRSTLIKNMQDSELNCPGSSFLANISLLKSLQRPSSEIVGALEELKRLSLKSRRGDKKDLLKFLENLVLDRDLLDLSKKIVELGGLSGGCDIVESYEYYDEIVIENSSKFKVRINPSFSVSTGTKIFEASNSYLIIADGVIDSVSEIHHVLEHFHKIQKNCFIVCRGYSNDVLKTLSENLKMKKLSVIPCELVVDLKSINSLKDISIVSGEKLTSNLAGENFSSIDVDELKPVNFIKATSDFMEIKNPSQQKNIISLIEKIRKNILEENIEDKVNLLQNRISSINPRRVVLKISNHNKDSFGIKKDRIKTIISLINNCCHSGFISLKNRIKNPLLIDIIEEVNHLGIEQFPAMAFFKGLETGLINSKMIDSSRKIIVRES